MFFFSKKLRENAKAKKYKGKVEGKKSRRKIKKYILKVNKLFLFSYFNALI